MTITAVVTAHGASSRVGNMVEQLHRQTRPPDEILVYASDVPDRLLDLDATVRLVRNRSDWGHDKRRRGLADATSEWVGFFNDDDVYDPDYLTVMEQASSGYDLVMCRFDEKGRSIITPAPTVGSCTAGNFLVRTEVARRVGWRHSHYEADGTFIAEVAAAAEWTVVDRLLYWHK